jgi:ectoine hydroxylase-related dioxygenase (phytanoyl-CoA dioxygenase family)
MAIQDMLAKDPVAVVTANRPEFTHHPFFSWQNGAAPKGYFSPGHSGSQPGMAEFFKENGFLVLQDGASAAEVDALNRETAAICRGDRGDINGIDATPASSLSDDEIMRRYLCIHFPHKISDEMYKALAYKNLVDVLTQVIGPNVKCMQSMLFIKASGKPGQAWHQDEYYIPTRDRSLLGAWIAMDDATVENGCLWVIPGSHKHGVLWPQHQQRDHRFDCAGEATSFPYSDEDAVPVEVKKGSIVFFNGYLLHRSLPNYAPGGFRRSLVNHYMSAESLLPWHWGEKPAGSLAALDYRDIVMVAGKDPYAWKGVEQRAGAHVRPSGEGGCGTPERNAEALKHRNMVLLEEDDHDH